MCILQSSDKGAGQQQGDIRVPPSCASEWFNPDSANPKEWIKDRIYAWGWFSLDPLPAARDFDAQGWKQTLDSIGADTGEWRFNRYEHCDRNSLNQVKDQTYNPGPTFSDGRLLHQTGALRQLATHRSKGVVILQPSRSPEAGARIAWGRDPHYDELPKFWAAADFLWYDWMRERRWWRDAVKNINYCGVQQVTDLATHRLIARYLLARNLFDLEPWPASNSVWDITTPEGRGLLASHPARQCVAFLAEHKFNLGIKHITSVKVFRSFNPGLHKAFPELLLTVENVRDEILKLNLPDNWVPIPYQPKPNPNENLPYFQPEPGAPLPRAAIDINDRKEPVPSIFITRQSRRRHEELLSDTYIPRSEACLMGGQRDVLSGVWRKSWACLKY